MYSDADGLAGMEVAAGILTSRGGMTSHAAVVARGMGKCCIVGAESVNVREDRKQFKVGSIVIKERDVISRFCRQRAKPPRRSCEMIARRALPDVHTQHGACPLGMAHWFAGALDHRHGCRI